MTGRSLAEAQLLYQALFEQSPYGILIIDMEGYFVEFNEAAHRQLGYSREEFAGLRLADIDPVRGRDEIEARIADVLRKGKATFEVKHRTKAGEIRDVRVITQAIDLAGRAVFHTIWQDISDAKLSEENLKRYREHLEQLVTARTAALTLANEQLSRDIAARKKAEEALRESEERYRTLIENAHDMIQSVDPEGRFIYVNSAWAKTMGYTPSELDQLTIFDILCPTCLPHCEEAFRRVMSGESVDSVEATFVTKDGRLIDVEGNVNVRMAGGKVIASQGIFHNVTERKKLEEQLRQAQKMESVGQFAGGIAHDFSNMVTAIKGYGEMLQSELAKESTAYHYVEQILGVAAKSASLTRQLLAFSRRQIISQRQTDVNDIVKNIENLLRVLVGEAIDLQLDLGSRELIVFVDPMQLEQVLVNLCSNARDAMPDGGTLSISTGAKHLDQTYVTSQGIEKPGDYVLITLKDTGCGMDEKTRKQIFEPLFTTKETGKGTGLGLSVVYGIIKQHGGHITASSSPGSGTIFNIYLPLSIETAEKEAQEETTSLKRGTETVLVAEDDTDTRNLLRSILQQNGYSVVEARDGEDAIRAFTENSRGIHLVVLDVVMPRKGGVEVYEAIRKIQPDIKVLFISGYADDIVSSQGIPVEKVEFMAKPFKARAFLSRIREILDR